MSDKDIQMSFDEWLQHGITQGYCGPPVCSTHDGTPCTAAEEAEFEEGYDPCITVIRPYEDAQVKKAVESCHAPSTWRRTNMQL